MEGVDTEAMTAEFEKSADAAPEAESPQVEQAPSITELDKLEKFKWEGKEYSPADLKKMTLTQQDYTRKTQELATERKFYDNLRYDLQKVRENPRLANEFRKIYPEKFHDYLEYVSANDLGKTQGQQPGQTGTVQTPQQKYAELDPEIVSRFQSVEKYVLDTQVKSIETQLQAFDQEFGAKYKMADQEAVYAKADTFYKQQKEKDPTFQLTKDHWESLWKSDSDKNQKKYESYYKELQNNQKRVSAKGRDVAPGGGLSGQAPAKYKNIREATDAALADLDS